MEQEETHFTGLLVWMRNKISINDFECVLRNETPDGRLHNLVLIIFKNFVLFYFFSFEKQKMTPGNLQR